MSKPTRYEISPLKSAGVGADGREEMVRCEENDPALKCFGLYALEPAEDGSGTYSRHLTDHKTKPLALAALTKIMERSKQSKGHVGWVGDYEYFKNDAGDLFRAHLTDVFDPATGQRQGRFEAMAAAADKILAMLGLVADEQTESRARDYNAKRAGRIERLEERADNASSAGYQAVRSAVSMLDVLPGGQPILVGHHSEKRHRALIARSDAKMRKGSELLEHAKQLQARAAGAINNDAISSDDPLALKKITERISHLEAKREWMKLVNKHFSKGTLDQIGIGPEEIASMQSRMLVRKNEAPFPSYTLTNLGANIRRLETRARIITAKGYQVPVEEEHGSIRIFENADLNRVQIFFPGKPSEEVRSHLAGNGFRFSYEEKAWQAFRSNWSLRTARDCVKRFFPAEYIEPGAKQAQPAPAAAAALTFGDLIVFQDRCARGDVSGADMQAFWEHLQRSEASIMEEYKALEVHQQAELTAKGLPSISEDSAGFPLIQVWVAGSMMVLRGDALDPKFREDLDQWTDETIRRLAGEIPIPAEAAAVGNETQAAYRQ